MSLIDQTVNERGVLTVTLNRPEKLNALSAEVLQALAEIFAGAKTNPAIAAILLTGSGKAFCAGADIARLATCNAHTSYQFACEGQEVFAQLETLGKPSLAAINGFALGGGCELAMAATIRIASTKASFAQPEVKLGIIPGYGGTQRLTRLIGKGRAMDLCLTGRTITAETALNWGLVSMVVEPEILLEQAHNMLNTILDTAPLAVASIMEVINCGNDLTLKDALQLEALHFAKVCASEDKQEGVTAFLNKRKANFKGK